ncbi:hypothetical protein WJX64_02950 [Leifsonia sp. YIM 134122]|uniref:Uncharacterized protein n=1 Tax=Leifsonia stereocauli TaxID=3134136 RepID=A0ABU9W0I8_9MICO
MSLGSEDAVKKALGIASFDDVTNDQVLALETALPEMSDEVRLSLIDKVPALQRFALEAMNGLEETLEKTLDANEKSRSDLHESLADVRSVLKGELGRDDISEDHRRFLVEHVVETARAESEQHTKTSELAAEQARETRKAKLTLAAMVIVTGLLWTGAKVIETRQGGGGQA